jgi:hypothetical protein
MDGLAAVKEKSDLSTSAMAEKDEPDRRWQSLQ